MNITAEHRAWFAEHNDGIQRARDDYDGLCPACRMRLRHRQRSTCYACRRDGGRAA